MWFGSSTCRCSDFGPLAHCHGTCKSPEDALQSPARLKILKKCLKKVTRTTGSRGSTGLQAAEDQQDYRQQRITRTTCSRGSAGLQAAEDHQDYRQERISRTTGSRGSAGLQAAEDQHDYR